jgi:micrococcal nuclease
MLPRKYKRYISLAVVLFILLFSNTSIITTFLQGKTQALPLATPTVRPKAKKQAITADTRNATDSAETRTTATVIRVVDGDTIVIDGNRKLRYIGMNTPETVDPRRPVQCFGKKASERNKELVEGQTVTLEKDISETDKYGRLLRYVYLDGVMINKQLVTEGYAVASAYPPDVKHQTELKQAETEARNNNLGLWSDCPIPTKTK